MLNDEQTMTKVRTAAATAKPTTWAERFAAAKFGSPEWKALCEESSAGIKDLAARQQAAEVKRTAGDWLTAKPVEPADAVPLVTRVTNAGGKFAVVTEVDAAAMAKATIAGMKTADGRPSQMAHH